MMKQACITLLLILLLIANACVEGYDAETDPMEPVLVVEGLVTTSLQQHTVKLSQTTPYSQAFNFVPERNAIVHVTDDEKNVFHFSESEPGVYISNIAFSGETGRSYVLHVETISGEVFRSRPQQIMPAISIDTVEGRFVTQQRFIPNNDGELVLTDVDGLEVFANIINYENTPPKFRFEPVALVQFIEVVQPENPDSPLNYCHLKVGMEDLINLTIPEIDAGITNTMRHKVAFIPVQRRYYPGLYIQHTRLDRRALILRQYSLNEDAFNYYQQLSDQLQADGSIFDPIAVQLYGNMFCMSDPGKPVLGFFEASGYYSETFKLLGEPPSPQRADLIKVHNLDYLPRYDCSYELRPQWWLF